MLADALVVTGTVVFFITVWVYILLKVPDQTLEPSDVGIYPKGVNSLGVGYQGIYTWSFWALVVLLGNVLLGMCVMGWAQHRTMELPMKETMAERARRHSGNTERLVEFSDADELRLKEERLLKLLLSYYEHKFEELGVPSKYSYDKVSAKFD